MKSEHFGEQLVNTLVNSFLREVNIMNSLRVYTPFIIKKKVYKSIHKYIHACVYTVKVFIVFTNRRKLFTKPFTNYAPNHSLNYYGDIHG